MNKKFLLFDRLFEVKYNVSIMTDEIIKKLQEHDKRFDQHDKRFDQLDSQVDFIVTKVLEHDERLQRVEENMVTKKDHQEVMKTLDKLVGLVQKTDQEITFMGNRINRIEEQTSKNTKDIGKMKPMLGLS